ncbi:hypothetical protein JYT74_00900, partial [Crocinitomix catalasitica]|nr:hypothetical protein [Crocinitomix catalasitica]
ENWEETLTTMTEGIAFSIKFIENGTLFFYRNGSLISEYRIKMKIFEPGNNCGINVSYEFHIDLDNIDELNFGGCLNSDTLITGGFPGFHFQPEQGCESYTNYFIKN